MDKYDKGIAFVFEGDTEKYFYINLLRFFCQEHEGYSMTAIDSSLGGTYVIANGTRKLIIRTNTVGTVTQIAHSGNWFNNACASKYPSYMPWDVFLCYDTDSYDENISKFYEGDWQVLRNIIKNRKNINIIDMAAAADMEDVFLKDMSSIYSFLGEECPLSNEEKLNGRKGKVILKKLFSQYGRTYHSGARAKSLIEALNMNVIVDSDILPLREIEKSIWE